MLIRVPMSQLSNFNFRSASSKLSNWRNSLKIAATSPGNVCKRSVSERALNKRSVKTTVWYSFCALENIHLDTKIYWISTATPWNSTTFITLIKGLLSMDIRSCQHLPTVSCRRTERTTINPTRNLCLQPSFRTACQLTLPSEDHTGTTGNHEISSIYRK